MAKRPRYQIERVSGSPELEQLQDRLYPLLEKLSVHAESTDTAAGDAATAGGTSFVGDSEVWATSTPTTVGEAIARLAYHVKSGSGAVPIVELPED